MAERVASIPALCTNYVQPSGWRMTNQHASRLAERVKQFSRRLRQNWIYIVVALVCGAVIFSGEVIRSVKDVQEFFFPGPDALSLAREASKDNISRDFVETTSRRIYLSRNFLARLDRRASNAEIDEAWKKLLASVEEMAAKQLIYVVSFAEYYSDARRDEYENGIQVDFNALTKQIVDLRYSSAVKKLEFSTQAQTSLTVGEATDIDNRIAEITNMLDILQIRLYHFAFCFDKRFQTDNACKSQSAGGSW
jgi:hypothetical protein